jgi:crotonobetainyl-CoA:carnitine CoA-transferase CaiB-like acyl-CoA transferase
MLEGLRVLDLTRLYPGPYATLVLADLGAQVDKLEDPRGGDYLRHGGPAQVGEVGAFFYALNRNKRSIALDLRRPEAAAAVAKLCRSYDVLVENFRPGVMERLGIGYERLSSENPRLVFCSLSGFGQTGPDRERSGHDLGYVARAGVLGYAGAPAGPPPVPGGQMADVGGALVAVSGILAALYARDRTGRGRHLDVSMTEAATAFFHLHLGARLAAGSAGAALRRGEDLLNGGVPCYGVYRTSDGRYLAVGALEPQFWEAFCTAIGRPELSANGHDAGAAAERTRSEIAAAIAARPLAAWVEVFRTVDACVEPVLEGDEVLKDAQHLRS